MQYTAEPKYQIGQIVETTRGSISRISVVKAEWNRTEAGEYQVAYGYHLQSSPQARGFYCPEKDIVRSLDT